MADDAMMLDQAMDIDNNAPPVPFTGSIPAATPRSPPWVVRARRNVSSANEKKGGNHDTLKSRRGIKSNKHSSNLDTHGRKGHAFPDHVNIARNRRLRIQHAIASGSFEVRSLGHLAETYGPSAVDRDDPQKLQRLNKDIVTQGLHKALPGLAFDPSARSCFTKADMADLVQALESLQMHLARKGKIILAVHADRLVRSYSREMMAIVMIQPKKLGCQIGSDEFWVQVDFDYQRTKKIRWLTREVIKLIGTTVVDTFPKWGERGTSFSQYTGVVAEALDTPGKHPMIDEALAEVKEDLPTFPAAQPSTLRSLVAHFEAARSRYLANLNTSLDQGNQINPIALKPKQGFGMLPQSADQYDSDNEDDAVQAGIGDEGMEDNGQVEERVPSFNTSWFLSNLDKWMALKNGQSQGGVDVDMFSALELM